MRKTFSISRNLLTDILVVLLCGAIPVLYAESTAEKPRQRYFHIESFRYGKDPAVIGCNRGDTLHLTFDSRDTGHSFFLQEFDLDVKVSPNNRAVLQFRAGDPETPPIAADTVVFVADHPGLQHFLVSKSVFHCHVYCGPMHAFEQGNFIINPNPLLYGGLGLLVGLLVTGLRRIRTPGVASATPSTGSTNEDGIDLLKLYPALRRLLKKAWLQPALMLVGGIVLYVVVLTTLLGTLVSGRNLGSMLVWVVWLFLLIVVLTPFGGRLWCMVCPLPAAGEWLQRRSIARVRTGSSPGYRNQFFGLQRAWPAGLSNGWPRIVAFLFTATLSTTFVAQPRTTGAAILTLALAATALSLVFQLRSFCRFLCPINTFLAAYSRTSRLALRRGSEDVCAACKGDFCEKGSHTGWACPYGLNVRTIDTDADCGMCTECLRSCVYDNATFTWRPFAGETTVGKASDAWSAMALFVVAIAYTIIYLGPWPAVRDFVNIVDKSNWGLFAIYTVVLWAGALLLFPLLMYGIAAVSRAVSGAAGTSLRLMVASTGALLPLGLFVWMAFIVQMLFVNVTFVGQSLNDPFGWGWNFLGLRATPWIQIAPQAVPWLQVLLVLIGFGYSVRNLWRIWLAETADHATAFKGVIPLALLFCAISGLLINFYAN